MALVWPVVYLVCPYACLFLFVNFLLYIFDLLFAVDSEVLHLEQSLLALFRASGQFGFSSGTGI